MTEAFRVVRETEHYAYVASSTSYATKDHVLEDLECLRRHGYRILFPITITDGDLGYICEKEVSRDQSTQLPE